MDFTSAVFSLFASRGKPRPAWDGSYPVSLIIDDRWELTLDLDAKTDEIVISVPIRRVGIDILATPDASRKLFTLSLLGAQTDGCSLSFSEETQSLVVWKRHPNDIPSEDLIMELLDRVLSVSAFMEDWCSRNLNLSPATSKQNSPQQGAEDTTGWFRI